MKNINTVLIRFIPQNGNLLLILFVSFLFIGCTDNGKDDIAEVNNAKIVKVLHLFDSKEFKNTYEYPATIYPFQNTVLTFEVPGKITKFNYNVAQRVKKGKVIAKLDDTIYQAKLNSAKATYEKAKLDYTRYKKLFLSKTISKSKIEVTSSVTICFFISCQSSKVNSASLSAYSPTYIAGSLYISDFGSIPHCFAVSVKTASFLPFPR